MLRAFSRIAPLLICLTGCSFDATGSAASRSDAAADAHGIDSVLDAISSDAIADDTAAGADLLVGDDTGSSNEVGASDGAGDSGCQAVCAGKLCGAGDGCSGTCQAGSGCCTPSCSGKLCGAGDGCSGTCQAGSGCCTPSCSGRLCGAGDGCSGTCQAGSGCCTPSCDRAVCGGANGCGGVCAGDNNDSCTASAETWRCVWINYHATWGSQVCRSGKWQTFNLNPVSCEQCCGSYSSNCSAP
jgi:hypothetical protein